MGGKFQTDMSTKELETKLAWHSQDTGIPRKELRRMCIQAGLDQLSKGELKVSAKPKRTKEVAK